MKHTYLKALPLLFAMLFAVIACDDDEGVEESIVTPLSDFEWTTEWRDVYPCGKPIVAYGGTLILPAWGSFDLVKVDTAGIELWRQSFPERFVCATEYGGGGIIFAGERPESDATIARFVSGNGELGPFISLDEIDSTFWPVAIAESEVTIGSFLIGTELNNSLLERVSFIGLTHDVVFGAHRIYDDEGSHRDFPKGIVAARDGGCIIVGIRRYYEGDAIVSTQGFAMRIGMTGERDWITLIPAPLPSEVWEVIETANNEFVAVGYLASAPGIYHAFAVGVNPEGAIVWQTDWPMNDFSTVAFGVVEHSGNLLVAGSAKTGEYAQTPFITRLSIIGELDTSRFLTGDEFDFAPLSKGSSGELYAYQRTSDNTGFSLSKLRQPIFPTP